MSDQTSIQWTDATWNPVTGCTKVSPGCKHCYAETFAERWRGIPGHPYEQGFDLRLWPQRLELPLKWRKPRMIFVNSMSDLFHERVPFEFINGVFEIMRRCPQHTFQILTKRPERMVEWQNAHWPAPSEAPGVAPFEAAFANVWLGTSVEDQERADERIPHLLQVPAAIRWLSVEPLLDWVDPWDKTLLDGIQWVVIGGESGPDARPMELVWASDLVHQCRAAGVAVFVKQLGFIWARENGSRWPSGKCDLKGACMENWREDLRVREWPDAV